MENEQKKGPLAPLNSVLIFNCVSDKSQGK
jgi:hypothetical protein